MAPLASSPDGDLDEEPVPSRHHSRELFEMDDLQEQRNLSRIATNLLERSFSVATAPNEPLDPRLDPTKPEFDHFRWAQAALDTLSREGGTFPQQDIVFSNLSVSGSGESLQYQETVLSSMLMPFRKMASLLSGRKTLHRRILKEFDGIINSGELLLVLGRPGSGCTTFLKTLCGHLNGLRLERESNIHFRGIGFQDMFKSYRGEVTYNQEVDEHFPHLTVGETLSFAAAARAPAKLPSGFTRDEYVDTTVKVAMATFGLSHTYNTKVGDNFVRGVSGGERKRVSIAEMYLGHPCFGAWDNSTRGLDAASALQFINALRLSADASHTCHAVAAYQASQTMYDQFNKVIVLYQGYEIYFGPSDAAVAYFEEMGWQRPVQQPAPDFLTAVTNPGERRPRRGMEAKVPRTAVEFAAYWKRSQASQQLQSDVAAHEAQHPLHAGDANIFQSQHQQQQARHTRPVSPYLLSVPMQVRICFQRAYHRMRNDLPTTLSTAVVQIIMSLIIGSIFYNSPNSSQAFFQKGAVMFFSVVMNALITVNEILLLYAQRPIVEKHVRYAFVHPFTEALSSSVIDLPIKFLRCTGFSIVLYFLADLRREPAQFFVFLLFLLTLVLTMSGIFRTLAALTKTFGQAMALAGILVLCIIVYTGFTLPPPSMHPWLSWIRWINPVFYGFEALLSNEFHSREFACSAFVPSYGSGDNMVCSAVGAVPGETFISGDSYIYNNYLYKYSHIWRNYGIIWGFLIAFHTSYLLATEYRTGTQSQAEALVYRPGHAPKHIQESAKMPDAEKLAGDHSALELSELEKEVTGLDRLPKQTDILLWENVCYDIPVKDGTRRLLNHVNGWVKPGTLTALMGVSGAGKTTLLDVLAQRANIGVVSGDILVNGRGLAANFPRRTGYVQQQDMHLETATVREALCFSALLRQPRATPKAEKLQYVEEVIAMLGMEDFSEAVVGILGEGLNVEQRKLLSIGVELVAKPSLLVFLDEPTSGLDSQSSWTIMCFLRKLADHGQAILSTIHQPSALVFQTFDRLLMLTNGGRTVYFGEIGDKSRTLLDYFERQGARPCALEENPAEYILEMVSGDSASTTSASPSASAPIAWPACWNTSPEMAAVAAELAQLRQLADAPHQSTGDSNKEENHDFAVPLAQQLWLVTARVFQQYYRQPEYIFSKFVLGIASGLFIGFSFWQANASQQGLQNALFSIFLLCSIFSILVNQIMPRFVRQRALYEVRERPSRIYSWKAFIVSQILVEIPWQLLLGICAYACFFFSVFGTGLSSESMGLILLFIVQFYIYAASMAQMVIAGVEQAGVAAMLAMLMFFMSFIFNGIMQPPSALPGFWIFMYRVSPFSYYVGGISGAALHGRKVVCSDTELSVLDPPAGQTCGEYLQPYATEAGGTVYNPNATAQCQYCSMSVGDQFLATRNIYYNERWRDYGIFICYFAFNTMATVLLYYVFRVRAWERNMKKAQRAKKAEEEKAAKAEKV